MANNLSGKNKFIPINVLKILLLIIVGVLSFLGLILPEVVTQSSLPMAIGDVTSQDVLAPYSLTFESEILTEQARQTAANAVDPIYLPIDPSISRQQVEELSNVLYYITTVRQDNYATAEEKIADIKSIEGFDLPDETIANILQLTGVRWEAIQFEATHVLEQVMRNSIKTSDVLQAKRDITSLIDFAFPQDQTEIVADLIEIFIIPNSLFSEQQTQEAISEAQQLVEPITRSFVAGETLVQRGEIISEVDWEALQIFGLIQPSNRTSDIIGAGVFTLLLTILIGLYFIFRKKSENYSIKSILLIAGSFLLFLGIARFFVIGRTIVPYVFPIAAFGLTLSVIFNFEIAVVLSIVLGVLTTYNGINYSDLSLFYIIPGIVGMLTIGRAKRIASFFLSGIVIGFAGVGIIIGFRLPDSVTDWIGIATLSGASIINGIAAAGVTLLLQYAFSQVLDLTTPLQLLDTSRPDHPLLQQMLRNAPGSYQHSLQVANLAEQAAEAIGADGLLVRVGAIFHDCGKSQNPQYFIENQVREKIDPHDDIDPIVSARTIINHVIDGVELAKKYHLPNRIIDFIREHHGTMYTHYQFSQALKNSDNPEDIDKSLFTYPGPKPQSRETALLMLADGTEARARAEVPKDEEGLRILIDQAIEYYEKNNQLDETNLTLLELTEVKESFFRTLKGTYHPRVKYPSLDQVQQNKKKS